MLGAIIGDLVGSRFEFNNYKAKDFDFINEKCFITDDSIMTLAVAKAIMETINNRIYCFNEEFYKTLSENAIKYMREIGVNYPFCGYGGRFYEWIYNPTISAYNSYGNGAAMRISSAGYVCGSEDEVINFSNSITKVTHNHPEGLKGAEATVMAIYLARMGADKSEIKIKMQEYYDLDFTVDGIRDTYEFNESTQQTVPQAIVCFLESISFEDAIRNAISIGGDSDTLGAITGGIAEAYYGIDNNLKDRALSYLDEDLIEIYYEWEKFLKELYYYDYIDFKVSANGQENKYLLKFKNNCAQLSVDKSSGEAYERLYSREETKELIRGFNDIKLKNDKRLNSNDINWYLTIGRGKTIHNYVGNKNSDSWKNLKAFFLGDSEDVQIKKLTINYNRKYHKSNVWEHKESIIIEHENLYLLFKRFVRGKLIINNQYYVGFGIDELLISAWKCLNDNEWIDEPKFYDEDTGFFDLEAELYNGSMIIHSGIYNRAHMPQSWCNFINDVFNFLCMFGLGDLLNEKKFMNSKRTGELKYCSVGFEDIFKTYYYLTDDENIKIGDLVLVPFGINDAEKMGFVENINYFLEENVPYPVEKTKKIISRVEDKLK